MLTVKFSDSFNVNYLKAGEYSLMIPVPDAITKLIGQIVVQWGGFEQRLDALIKDAANGMKIPLEENWQRQPFKKRKRIFKDVMTEYTKRRNLNEEQETLRRVADKSGELHWQRNIVAHGYIEIRNIPGSQDARFFARGQHNGNPVEIPLEVETLDKLRHDIMHLSGNMMQAVFKMGGNVTNGSQELVIADKDLLQDQQHGSFQTVPTPNIPKLPPQPSGA